MGKIEIELKCGCGGADGIHKLGIEKCFRKLVQKNEEPKRFGVEKKMWKLPKSSPITEFTLKQQRGYSFHEEEQRWSKPKVRGKEWFETKGWD